MEAIFGTQGHVGAVQECMRALVIFAFGFVLVRTAGRRTFSKWSAIDIIVSIVLGSNLSRALTGAAPLAGTLAATLLLVMLHRLLAHAAARWPAWSRVLEGVPITIGEDGALDPAALKRSAISTADLNEALRQTNVGDVRSARLIVLEPSGKITVLKGS